MKISLSGNYLVYEKQYSLNDIESLINKHQLNGLSIMSLLSDEIVGSLEFLRDATFLKGLSIVGCDFFDLSSITALKDLVTINLNVFNQSFTDFSEFKHLKSISLSMQRKKHEICLPDSLVNLYLEEIKDDSLQFLHGGFSLSRLKIKSSSLKRIDIKQAYSNIEYLYLGGISGINEIIADLPTSVIDLTLDSLRGLKKVSLENMGNLKDIEIRNCKSLVELINIPPSAKRNIFGCNKLEIVPQQG